MGSGKPRVLIAGVGNELMGDDGLGPVVLSELTRRSLPDNVDVIDFGERLYDLLLRLEGYDVAIVVDALDMGGEPGDLYVVEPSSDPDEIKGLRALNLHETGLRSLLALGRELGMIPGRIHIVGCQPEDTSRRVGLSEIVKGRMDDIVGAIVGILKSYT